MIWSHTPDAQYTFQQLLCLGLVSFGLEYVCVCIVSIKRGLTYAAFLGLVSFGLEYVCVCIVSMKRGSNLCCSVQA